MRRDAKSRCGLICGVGIFVLGICALDGWADASNGVVESHDRLTGHRIGQVVRSRKIDSANGGPTAAGDGLQPTYCQENPDHETIDNLVDENCDLTATDFEAADAAPSRCADNFDVLCDGEITGAFWVGAMIRNVLGGGGVSTFSCPLAEAPQENDNWTVRYWLSNNDDLPGEMVAEYTSDNASFTRVDTGDTNVFGDTLYRTDVVFDTPVQVQAGVKYFVEIYNNYEFNACFATIEPAPPGDSVSIQAGDGHPDGWDPLTDDVIVNDGENGTPAVDLHQCQAYESGPKVPNPPSVRGFITDLPDIDTGCCQIAIDAENRNCLSVGAVETYYVAIAAGTGADTCFGLENISAPVGYTVDFCEDWSDGFAILRFTGGSISELASALGQIRIDVNGDTPLALDAMNTVPADGLRFWGSQDTLGESLCGTGTFGPLEGQVGEWSGGENALCALQPIPASTMPGRMAMTLVLLIVGVLLVSRSRSMPTAA